MTTLLVIPSIRSVTAAYLSPLLSDPTVHLLIVDDADGHVKVAATPDGETMSVEAAVGRGVLPPTAKRFDRVGIEAFLRVHGLDALAALIPQKNPSCKNFGLLYAWLYGYDRVFLLDDDCDAQVTPTFLADVPLGWGVWPEARTRSGWTNPTALLSASDGLYSRGYPYEYRGETQEIREVPAEVHVVFNAGLWTGTPDINGIDKLQRDNRGVEAERTLPGPQTVCVPAGGWLPLSIMNVQLETSLVPAFWQPPDFLLPGGWRVRRHDDVWAAMVLSRTLSESQRMAFGAPLIWHRKAGDALREALSEHPTNLAQRYLYEALLSLPSKPMASVDIGEHLFTWASTQRGNQFLRVVQEYGAGLTAWASAFERIAFGALAA